jgi:hypothetical protein
MQIKTKEDALCVEKTMEHRLMVKDTLDRLIHMLKYRGETHDLTKLEDPEFPLYSRYTSILSGLTYNSAEYKESLRNLEPALKHHYANSRHHPEHFKDGIRDMNLVDLVEMFIDWYCSSKRHNDGNIRKSIEINKERFNFSDDLARILENSVDLLDR